MIILLPQLTPSEILCYNEHAPFINELLRRSRTQRQEGRLSDAERFAQEAWDDSREAGDHISQGAALICLSDVHREMGRLGPALSDSQRAHRIFQRQPSRYQRHNEAIAAYAFGLVHHLLGNDVDALKWFRTADEQFEKVRREWTAVNDLKRVEVCNYVRSWLRTLTKHLISAQASQDVNLTTRVQVPVVRSNSDAERFAIIEMEIDRYRVDRRLMMNGDSFRLQSVKGNQRITIEPGTECYALEIPQEAYGDLGADEGDYALIVRGRDVDREGPGVLETLSGTEFGDFKRGEAGDINFVSFKAALVLGSEEIANDFEVGYIAALMRPESRPTSPPHRHKPPAPAPKLSAPSAPRTFAGSLDPYNKLIQLVKGNKEIADRLLEYERQFKPDASILALAELAIARLLRNRP